MSDDEETLQIRGSADIARVRRAVARTLDALGASSLRRTRFVTAASEIARNTLVHGRGGTLAVRRERGREGTDLVLVFSDKGPGIADPEAALRDGFTTGGGLGLGLGGARRLSDRFEIRSAPGEGTRVTIAIRVKPT